MSKTRSCLILMTKFPQEGTVKTRLGAQTSLAFSAELAHWFLVDMLTQLAGLDVRLDDPIDVVVFCDPPDRCVDFQDRYGSIVPFNVCPQTSGDLGVRLIGAVQTAAEMGYGQSVIIGSDTPYLPLEVLRLAFLQLSMVDVVISGVEDGGYCMIGLRHPSLAGTVFTDISWSTDQVFEQTLQRCSMAGLTVFQAPRYRDIDTLDDLIWLVDTLDLWAFQTSHTADFLSHSSDFNHYLQDKKGD